MPDIRLLVIEDDPDVAELLITYFEMVDYQVFHGRDGQEGIALARTKHPNLILLDVMLPDIDGWQVAEALRTAALTRYIPIIFLTQRTERKAKLRGLSLGADDYVTKPFDVEELRLRIQTAIRRARQDRLFEPRTGLPGSPLINAELARLNGEQHWHQLQASVVGLEVFRDLYGFLAADEALAFAAKTILNTVREHGTNNDFVGIADDDSLIILTHAADPQQFRQALVDTFNSEVRSLYNFRDAERGYVVLHRGTEHEEQVPLMTMQVALV